MLQIRLEDPAQYQSIVDAEWNIIYQKLDQCAASGAKIVLSRLAIGDLGTQYFADRDIFCAGRVRLSKLHVDSNHRFVFVKHIQPPYRQPSGSRRFVRCVAHGLCIMADHYSHLQQLQAGLD